MNRPKILILAAGDATRLGIPKALFKVTDQAGQEISWLEKQAKRLAVEGQAIAGVVVGKESDRIQQELSSKVQCEWIKNPDPDRGPFSSLFEGLRALGEGVWGSSGIFILPIDVPVPDTQSWQMLLRSIFDALMESSPEEPRVEVVKPVAQDDQKQWRGGHPVWIGPEICRDMLDRERDVAKIKLNDYLNERPANQIRRIQVEDPRVLKNFNTPEDFKS